jgi:bis(5'-nucleosyl)-tetraphosphatase (symmetrical)
MSKLIIYGDIHGCLDELIALRKKIGIKKGDIEISVGDIMSKGPKDLETLRYIMKENIIVVRGNNDDRLLNKNPELFTTKELAFLSSLPFFYRVKNVTVIHAGITPFIKLDSISKQEEQELTKVRYLDKNYKLLKPKESEKNFCYWSEIYDGREGFIVYGHQVFSTVREDKFSLGIDTGSVFGQELTAAIFEIGKKDIDTKSYKTVSQPAFECYFKSKKMK